MKLAPARHVVLLLLGLLTSMVGLVCACPDDVVRGIYSCLRHVASTEIAMPLSHDLQVLESKCLDGSFDLTISCVQDMSYTCRHDNTRMDLIQRTVDVAKLQSAFQHLCSNLQVQTQSADCVSQYKDRINQCSADVAKEFRREKHFAHTSELYLELICSFMNAITRCMEQPVRWYCSSESADVTVRLMSGLKPPACPAYNTAYPRYVPPVFMITMATFALFIAWIVHL